MHLPLERVGQLHLHHKLRVGEECIRPNQAASTKVIMLAEKVGTGYSCLLLWAALRKNGQGQEKRESVAGGIEAGGTSLRCHPWCTLTMSVFDSLP